MAIKQNQGVSAFLIVVGFWLFVATNSVRPPPREASDELTVVLNVPLQILSSAGDRFLAANAGAWRAIVVDATKMSRTTVSALAQIQENASWMNPAHEDNYYVAAAILPWEGELQRAQTILSRAMEARPGDILPSFFYGFNQLQFLGDWQGAYRAAVFGAEHAANDGDRQLMTVMAVRWAERSDDLETAQRVTTRLAANTKDSALRQYLEKRLERLQGLAMLREGTREFERRTGRRLVSLEELVSSGIVDHLPKDEIGLGYEIVDHVPVLRQKYPGKQQ